MQRKRSPARTDHVSTYCHCIVLFRNRQIVIPTVSISGSKAYCWVLIHDKPVTRTSIQQYKLRPKKHVAGPSSRQTCNVFCFAQDWVHRIPAAKTDCWPKFARYRRTHSRIELWSSKQAIAKAVSRLFIRHTHKVSRITHFSRSAALRQSLKPKLVILDKTTYCIFNLSPFLGKVSPSPAFRTSCSNEKQ